MQNLQKQKTIDGIVGCVYMDADCQGGEMYEGITMANADSIRAMSDEELAKILIFYGEYGVCHIPYFSCPGGKDFNEDQYEDALRYTINWLKQPVEEGK